MSEQVLYNAVNEKSGARITVTDTRVRIGNTTYSMANITSVSITRSPPNRAPGIVIAFLGIVVIAISLFYMDDPSYGIYIGAGMFIVGLIIAALAKGDYYMRIGSASGESNALQSTERGSIEPVVEAIEKAIIMRG